MSQSKSIFLCLGEPLFVPLKLIIKPRNDFEVTAELATQAQLFNRLKCVFLGYVFLSKISKEFQGQ
jgi:hypothetical protein